MSSTSFNLDWRVAPKAGLFEELSSDRSTIVAAGSDTSLGSDAWWWITLSQRRPGTTHHHNCTTHFDAAPRHPTDERSPGDE